MEIPKAPKGYCVICGNPFYRRGKTCSRECSIKYLKACGKAYQKTEKYKAYRREYMKKYQKSEKFKLYQKVYHKTEEYKARLKAYHKTEKYKAYRREYMRKYQKTKKPHKGMKAI